MSTEENKATERRHFEELWNQGNLAVADELFAITFLDQSIQPPIHGLEALKHLITLYRTAFPDLYATIEDQIAEGDKVVNRLTIRGTHQGDLMGISPTGKQISVTGIVISRFDHGKIVEGWSNIDTLGLFQQLGVIPAPGQAS